MNRPAEKRSDSEMCSKDKRLRLYHLDMNRDNAEEFSQDEVVNNFDSVANVHNFMGEGHQGHQPARTKISAAQTCPPERTFIKTTCCYHC